jgi:hypothetical protein
MGFLRQSSNPAYVYKYNGVQIQSSSNTVPITILYGTNRLAPNAISMRYHSIKSKAERAAAKGLCKDTRTTPRLCLAFAKAQWADTMLPISINNTYLA